MDDIIYLILNHIKDLNINHRHYKNKITLLDKNNIGLYQLSFETKDGNFFAHAISIGKTPPKRSVNTKSHATFLVIPRKKRLFSVELHIDGSFAKIDTWLKEIQSKLK